jgi:hypothetical protein
MREMLRKKSLCMIVGSATMWFAFLLANLLGGLRPIAKYQENL